MSIVQVVLEPNQPLREKAREVEKDADVSALIADLFDSMRAAHGIGVAAPQIGQSLRMFVIDPELFAPEERPAHAIFINPLLVKKSFKHVPMEEGCLSTPRMFGVVKRPTRVTVEAYDEHWKKFRVSASGLFARVLQHELDHLDGVLFIDKAEKGTLHEYVAEEIRKDGSQ